MSRRVAVIGAGCSGLTCIKCCLDEGLEPVCFESSDDIGGLWRFKESTEKGHSSIYRSLMVNTSKEMMCFSDFPMPAAYPNYMHNSQLLQYFHLYAQHFDLLRHIHFQTTVHSVRQMPDFSDSGQWEVLTETKDGQEERHVFDAVMVCSGQYTSPHLPLKEFSGIDTFPGTCSHSWEYKDPDQYRGKRVVVVGIGNSGGDIAVDISRVAEKTFLSTRRGAWVIGRMSDSGLPLDMVMIRRMQGILSRLLPRALLNWAVERGLNQRYNHKLYGLQPSHRIFDRRPLINDDLPGRILVGALLMKPNVREFQGSNLIFDDGTAEEKIDAVVFCTGYKGTFPFLPQSLLSGPDRELTLYKRVFPPDLQRPTLAIMGLFQTTGPIMQVVEMQARWATRVIAGLNHLPPGKTMHKIIEKDRRAHMRSYPCPKQAALQVQYIPYLDAMAQEVGALPSLFWLLLRDPRLGFSVLFGPCTPYQYRLCGPGKWEGARQAILTQWDRVAQPMKTRSVLEERPFKLPFKKSLFGVAVLTVAVVAAQNIIPALPQSPAELRSGLSMLMGALWDCRSLD